MPINITNLKSLKNAAVFSERKIGSTSLEFRRYNLIYGFNGSGKSTLSRIFASFEANDLHEKLPPSCSFEFDFDDNSCRGHPAQLTGLEQRLLVFNNDFIERNFKWAEGIANPVFFIGEDQTEAAAKLENLDKQLPLLETSAVAAESKSKKADKELSNFKRLKAKEIAAKLHLGNRKYEAPQLTKDYDEWRSTELIILVDDDLRAKEDNRKLEEPLPTVELVEFDAPVVEKAFKFVREICGQTLSSVALSETKKFPEMLIWLKEGHKFHEENELVKCLLCGNQFSEERKSLLKNALDNKIDQFIHRLSVTEERLHSIFERLHENGQALPRLEALSTELRPSVKEASSTFKTQLEVLRSDVQMLQKVLKAKQRKPATPVDTATIPKQSQVEQATSKAIEAVNVINLKIAEHNSVAQDFEKHREQAGVAIRKHFLAINLQEFSSRIRDQKHSLSNKEAALKKLDDTSKEADDLRNKIKTHGPAAPMINKVISSYLGHNELTIEAVEHGYELHRHGKVIDGFPSEGEKTAIAISYFLSTIESEGRKLKDLIVVVDDPVSSLDTKALNYACSLLKNRLTEASQLFILTHNQQCLNEFRKAWKNKLKPQKGKEPTATFLYIDVTIPKGTVRRSSSIVPMSRLLREYDSEYHFLFSQVLSFSRAANDYSEYGYMIPNVLRRVMDIFLAFKCPGNSGMPGKIEQICTEYPNLDREKLFALERLAQVESHSDNLDDLISFSSMTLEETKQATEALLLLMTTVDETHTNNLTRICS